jgi:L,D-peptidoglycan transpeptidase YkuD (ErfK/YbiS/YcfS/YnhG family)
LNSSIEATQLTVSKTITYLHVFARNACSSLGVLKIGQSTFPCLLGKSGRRHLKREGDGASPIGIWKLEQLYFRSDKMGKPRTPFSGRPLKQNDGWCDAAGHGLYNRHVTFPLAASHENLWRKDQAYDLVITTNHNQRPRKQAGGSAIFLHVINQGAKGTEGCVALSEKHLRMVLARCSSPTYLVI